MKKMIKKAPSKKYYLSEFEEKIKYFEERGDIIKFCLFCGIHPSTWRETKKRGYCYKRVYEKLIKGFDILFNTNTYGNDRQRRDTGRKEQDSNSCGNNCTIS